MLVFVFFFLMIRRPPISTRTDTLFPYTTLFRSFARHINPPFAASGRVDSGDPSFVIFAKLSVSGIFERRHIRSEEHTSELQSLMRISYAVFCLKKNKTS